MWFKIKNLYHAIFTNFWHKFKRSTSWFIFSWTNNDWDFYYLYKVIQKKIVQMRDYMKNSPSCGARHDVKIMNICLWYLNKIIDNDICDSLYEKFYAKYGKISFKTRNNFWENCKAKEENDKANKIFMRIAKYETYLWEKYKNKVFYIISKYSTQWWD
jgi:hypothetical protein